ncbi:MAG: 30S ribosomal protein S18 [Deltaproteobacteria bacterium]|nr:30S ribosomal protein S18 [Deltaproteobacteria bacterium]
MAHFDKEGGGRGERGERDGKKKGKSFGRKKVCRFCADKTLRIDFKDYNALKYFITERGKIIPRRISGNCAGHQRELASAVSRARMIALLPFTAAGM